MAVTEDLELVMAQGLLEPFTEAIQFTSMMALAVLDTTQTTFMRMEADLLLVFLTTVVAFGDDADAQ